MAAGARIKLAVPCQPDGFDPTLLSCAKKRGVEPPRRSCFRCAYRATEQKGCDPFDIPGVLISNCYPVERFYGFRQHSRSGLQLQTSLQLVQRSTCRAVNMAVPTAARHFCSAKMPCGRLRWGTGDLIAENAAPLFGKESRGNLFQGFPLGNFFLTADAVLLCAAKKNGVGTWTSWHVTPEAHWPYLATAGNNKIRAPLSA